jgi:glyoxylase-like metal-dependent hydrolase (beta-lactamase superfamily II)
MTPELPEAGTPALSVGGITCRVLTDGQVAYEPGFLFANVDSPTLNRALEGRLDEEGRLATPYQCLLIETPTARILIDTGLGRQAEVVSAPAGRMLKSLESAGMSPGDVDVVVLSHAHPDHIGGLLHNGQLTFPDARHVMSRIEWEYWTSPDKLGQLPESLAAPARALLPPLAEADVLDLTDQEMEIVPGVRVIPAPGHTPGHTVVSINSRGSSLLFMADAILDELQLTQPHWVSAVDWSATKTESTRRRLLDQACIDGSVILAYHMTSIGSIERFSGAYKLAERRQVPLSEVTSLS